MPSDVSLAQVVTVVRVTFDSYFFECPVYPLTCVLVQGGFGWVKQWSMFVGFADSVGEVDSSPNARV